MSTAALRKRWPRVGFAVKVHSSGYVDCDYYSVETCMRSREMADVERADTWEELARFWEWRLEQRTDELAGDRVLRHLVAKWTDSLCYSLRRLATFARGEDPGPVIPEHERRPDLDAEQRTIVDEIVADLDRHGDLDHGPTVNGRLVGAGAAR